MKRAIYNYIILLIVCQVCVGFFVFSPVFAGVNDFSFSDFTGDYYLSKDESGISHLKVVESVTAEFPDFNQNKGICRQIPFTNQDGANLTLPRLTRDNLTLTRNGEIEPIYSIDKESNYYNVCTGDDNYVLGSQTYVFGYTYEKVVTEFADNGRTYQELYWDTNGNGASQTFDSVTARLHFENPEVFTGESWCYVGRYGESGRERCTITTTDDGVMFEAKDLRSFEGLTFDVELKPDSFVIPLPEKNYTYVWIALAALAISLLIIGTFLKKYLKVREKAKYYEGIFVAPQYQPHKEYSLPEMAEIYLGKKKDMKVAMLLEMVVKRQIELKKGEGKKWSIIVKSEVPKEYLDLLKILNGGLKPKVGDEIEIKRRSATSQMISIKNSMNKTILANLEAHNLVEAKYNIGSSVKRGVGSVITTLILGVPMVMMIGLFVMSFLIEFLNLETPYGQEMVFYPNFYGSMFVLIVISVVICAILSNVTQKYVGHTNKGLEAARYMDGLRMYIEMAEADRLKFLQGVKTADTSAEGIVKLYEKLLPYAAVFGLEESWMNEMREYCEVSEIEEPDYLLNGIIVSDLMRSVRTASSYANTATTMSSSGGGSSSGFSGGGGGGFSGGGGGGGGFSGR